MTGTLATQNFLIPNGTFFAELIIFLLVFAVIRLFVVPPVREVLAQRAARVETSAADRQRARDAFAAAEHDYRSAVSEALTSAAARREDARKQGRALVTTACRRAQDETDDAVATATALLRADAARIGPRLDEHLDTLATDLAHRMIGGGR
ncbi:F0F1 ATP synthase subunit B family protein [Nocardia sp. NPDC055321]